MEPVTAVAIPVTGRADVGRLVQAGYDVDNVRAQSVVLYADGQELDHLRAAGLTWSEWAPKPPAPGWETKVLGAYNNYAAMSALLDSWVAAYPAICRKTSLGKTVQNRDIWALKITTNPDTQSDKPEFRYVGGVHGNEPVGTEMCLYFIDALCQGWAANDLRLKNLVENVELWVVPMNNPDGREKSTPSRYNANSIDLNRNYPEGSASNYGNVLYGPTPASSGLQIETQDIMNWTMANNFTMGVHFHTGTMVVNYPYDNDNLGSVFSPSPDENLFATMALTYSSNNAPMYVSTEFTRGIVNGAAWYAVSGGVQDWSYRYNGSLEVTIELSDYQWPYPAASQLATYWSQNKESMFSYMEWCLRGVRGIMTDAVTGAPIRGAVRVEGTHHLVFSDADAGDYHRVLLPGTYDLWFYAPGYQPRRVTNVAVDGGAATRVDVTMQPVSARFSAKVNFQPAAATIPTGFVADSGLAFGSRGGNLSYGWESNLSASGIFYQRNAGRSQDLRYDTCCASQVSGTHTWEIAVPNGPYSVLVAAGDPNSSSGTYQILAEGVTVVSGSATADRRWLEGLGTVTVTDGRLTIANGAGASGNRLAFVEISAIEPTTIAQWRALHFGTTENTGAAANTADQDQDALANLLEYAFGLVPTTADRNGLPVGSLVAVAGGNRPAFTFVRNRYAGDLTYTVEASDRLDPLAWTTVATMTSGGTWSGSGTVEETAISDSRMRVTVHDAQALVAGQQRFLRLLVSVP